MQIVEEEIDVLSDNNGQNLDLRKHKTKRKRKLQNRKMDAFGNIIDNSIYILVTAYIADIFLRFLKALFDYYKYKHHYIPENRLWTILCRAYTYNVATMVIFLCIIAIAIVRVSCTKSLNLFPPLNYLAYMPLWWLCQLANLSHSTLDYAVFIRGNHGLDSASSMAANFFHGYLKFTLPAYSDNSGIRERIDMYEQKHGVKFATDRLIITVPSKLFIHSKFESPYLEKAEPLQTVYRNRAGVFRPYQNDVYRFTKRIENRTYYMALEGATPILTFFETLNFQLTTTRQIQEMQREILLKFYKYLKRLVETWPETEREIELIFYDDNKPNGEKQDIGEMLFKHFENKLVPNKPLNANETLQTTYNYYL